MQNSPPQFGSAQSPSGNWLARFSDWLGNRFGWSRQTTLFAISVSLFIHMALLLMAALVLQPPPVASASDGDGKVPLAVRSDSDLQDTIQVSLADQSPSMQNLSLDDMFERPQIDMPSTSLDLSSLDLSALGEIGGAGALDEAAGSAVFEGGSGGAASFFGLESSGSRFAYIVDVSGSMSGARIEALKRELVRSVSGLRGQAQFSIVLFSSGAQQLGPSGWRSATDQMKREARTEIGNIRAGGSTVPMPAFDIIFELRPRPDAIYFMTDGIFSNPESVAADIARLNRSTGRLVPIHCITFIDRDAEEIMKLIARQSGGSYTHVSGTGGP